MKIIIVGGSAAGPKVAAKIKREKPDAEVTLFTRAPEISYAGCGLPYYVGDVIHSAADLIVNTPGQFSALTGAKIFCRMEMTALSRSEKTVLLRDLESGKTECVAYDVLVLATGAEAVRPDIPGTDLPGVYTLRTPSDAAILRRAVDDGVTRAVVVGGGLIGLETAENLARRGVRVSVLEMRPQILPGFDEDFSDYVAAHLSQSGIPVFTDTRATEILGAGHVEKVRTETRTFKADAVILCAGIRPNTAFLQGSGLELAPNGTILTDDRMRTNDPCIYAVGDCACVRNLLTSAPVWSPMGSSANLEGRCAANAVCGLGDRFPGVLGTAVAKIGEIHAARTGLSHRQALAAGYDACSAVIVTDDKAHYYPGSSDLVIRLTCDRTTHRFLGMQAVGRGAVDKLADIAVTALTLGASLEQLQSMDLAYAPPFSTAIHPFSVAVNVLGNKLRGALRSAVWNELDRSVPYTVIDLAPVPSVPGCRRLDPDRPGASLDGLAHDAPLLLVCTRGKRAYLAQRRLRALGYCNTVCLEGGLTFLCDNIRNLVS